MNELQWYFQILAHTRVDVTCCDSACCATAAPMRTPHHLQLRAVPEYGQQQGMGLLAEDVEIMYCVFDLLQHDGRSVAHEPLEVRQQLLRQAIAPCVAGGCVLQRGATAVMARVVPVLPGREALVPGCPASQFWSVQIRTAAELLVRAPILPRQVWSATLLRLYLLSYRF